MSYLSKNNNNNNNNDVPDLPPGWDIAYDSYSERYIFINPSGKLQWEPPNINEKNDSQRGFFSNIIGGIKFGARHFYEMYIKKTKRK